MKFGLSDEQLRQVQAILSKYPAITEAVVFGSRAMGNYREASDVDIALKGNVTPSMVADVKYTLEEDTYLPFFFDIIAYGIIDAPKLKEHIDKYGVALYRAGWKECRLADAPLEIIDGDRGTNYPKQDEFSQNGYCLFLNAKNVTVDGFAFDECYFISKEKDQILRKGKLQRNDIVLTTRGTVGNIGFFNDKIPYENIRLNSGMVIIRPDPTQISPEYTHQLFKYLKSDFDVFATGSAQPQLPIRDLKEILVSLPSLPEQRAIAAVLSGLDDKIDLLHRQNKTLEGMASALWRKMFVEEAGSEWETTTIGEVAGINGKSIDKNYTFTEIEYLDTGSITEGRIVEYQHLQLKDAPSRAKRIVQKNDIVVSMVRPIQKHYGILKKVNSNTIVSTGFVVISCVKIDPHFIYVLLTQKEMTEYLDIIAEASTTTYPSLAPSDIAKIDFQMPPTELLQQFSEYAEHVWDKIEENNSQIRTLSRFRDTLLPKLISGEVRVKV